MTKPSFLFAGIFCLLCSSQTLYAQTYSDSLWLSEVEVRANRLYVQEKFQPVHIQKMDSASIRLLSNGNHLGDLLNNLSSVTIRGNGPGGLSLSSQRGYSSSQTQVLWNGFQLNHSMLGLTDLSLIPAFAVDQLTVSSGSGNSSFGGKGGGSIIISTREPKQHAGFSQSIGSFGRSTSEFSAGVQTGDWKIGVVGGFTENQNDFSYQTREFSNEAGGFVDVEKKRANNELSSGTGILTVERPVKDARLKSILWVYDSENNIPGGITSPSPEALQRDSYLRFLNSLTGDIGNIDYRLKTYFNRQDLDFINPASNINSLSTSTSVITDLELGYSIHRKLQLTTSYQAGFSFVDATDYAGKANRTELAIMVNPVWHPAERLHVFAGGRLDYYSDFKEAWSGEAGFNFELLTDILFLKAQGSRNFITPTFNDLYWPGLGNPDLVPETNLKFESGILFDTEFGPFTNTSELTVYSGQVENGIRWLPGDDGRSRPLNIEELSLSGFEIREELGFRYGDFNARLGATLLHSLASMESARFEGDEAVGKQLRYVPEWQIKTNLRLGWRGFSSLVTYNFIEERFSTADHSSPFDPLAAYREMNTVFSYLWTGKRFSVSPSVRVYNLLDEEYSLIRDYPMPGRNFIAKLTLQLTLK